MINNIELIAPLLHFDSEDDFYFIQILQRKKENPQLGSNSRVVKDYFVGSVDKLQKLMPEMITLCQNFNARAMIRLNKRSYEQVAMHMMEKLVGQIINKDFKSAKRAFSAVSGQYHHDKNKTWILDIDCMLSIDALQEIQQCIYNKLPIGDKVVAIIPSLHGCHIITKPFNLENFKDSYSFIDIHKDNPTNLYIP